MADEAVVVAPASPVQSDHHKRKLDDLELTAPEPPVEIDVESDSANEAENESDAKRPRFDENADALATQNGCQEKNTGELREDDTEQPLDAEKSTQLEDGQEVTKEAPVSEQTAADDQQTGNTEHSDAKENPEVESTQEDEPSKGDISTEVAQEENVPSADEHPEEASAQKEEPSTGDIQDPSSEVPQKKDVPNPEEHPSSDDQTISRKMEVPSKKVGVLIGKSGDTIRYLQYNSGAKIQITRDSDADPHSATRPVELIGTLESIIKAEKLIKDVIAEADAGGSPALVARGFNTVQAVVGEQIEIQVPSEKVGLIIGKGGDTIKSLQTRSGARIQLVPQLSEREQSKERTVRVTGDKKQIETARMMIEEVMNQPVRASPRSSGYGQQSSRSRGPAPPQWGPRVGHPGQFSGYDSHHRGPYPSHSPQYPHSSYGNYPPQQVPANSFGAGWEQRPPASMQGPPSQANYNYGRPQGPEYGQSHSYHQTPHGQGYGHGGHGHSQPTAYPQGGTHPSYGTHDQYGKPPSYGAHPQASHSQPYGQPRANQPGEVPPNSSIQGYGANVPHQQQYPYASGGQMQQTYPAYGSTQADGYNHPQSAPASGQGYPQQPPQAVSGYGQPVAQQPPAYAQAAPAGGYGSYPSQPAYTEQQAATNAGYGYQGPVDQTYGAAQVSTAYSAPPTGQQGYAQTAPAAAPATIPTQPGYDQSMAQSGGYGTVPAAAAQPGYAHYDANQMYGAPR